MRTYQRSTHARDPTGLHGGLDTRAYVLDSPRGWTDPGTCVGPFSIVDVIIGWLVICELRLVAATIPIAFPEHMKDGNKPANPEKLQTAIPHSSATDARRFPGLLSAVAVAVLSGVLFWTWLSSRAGMNATRGSGTAVVSELAPVNRRDLNAALTTMDGSDAFLARFKNDARGCPQPLAWVSVALAPGQPPGTVRLQSGAYFSPTFTLTSVPLRVAIPYPAPYETGYGRLSIMHTGGTGLIALRPTWYALADHSVMTRDVTWHHGDRCKSANE